MNEVKNFVMISPNFPVNFEHFAQRLNERDINVLGIGDAPYDGLSQVLKDSLAEYYYVPSLENDEYIRQALRHFEAKHGKIDRLESHNEYWMELDARMRTEFDIPGVKNDEIEKITQKSEMKEVFRKAGVRVAEGGIAEDFAEVEKMIKQLGYPVIVKPDRGLGASDTWKIENKNDLAQLKKDHNPDTTYIIEEFITGDVVSFDGLTDKDGNVVFYSYFVNGVTPLDIAMDSADMYYYAPREVPEELVDQGISAVREFGIKERFFHIEFFKTLEDDFVALELNCRPPGGNSLDIINFANDLDLFAEYANIVKDNKFYGEINRPYNACYISRRDDYDYVHSHEDIWAQYSDNIVLHERIAEAIADLMGDEGFIVRTTDFTQMKEMVEFILAKN